jgi:hypothetical protein
MGGSLKQTHYAKSSIAAVFACASFPWGFGFYMALNSTKEVNTQKHFMATLLSATHGGAKAFLSSAP